MLGVLGTDDVWAQPWLFVGLGAALSATFVEPYFGTPRAAILNAVGGIGASAGANPRSVQELWIGLGIFFGAVLVAGVTAAITADGSMNASARQFAARFGRATTVAGALLLLIILTEANAGEAGFELLTVGTAVLMASLTFDWVGIWSRLSHPQEAATAVAAVGPRMLLVSGAGRTFREGESVEVDAGGQGRCSGSIVSRMPHADGLRYRIALSSEWTTVTRGFPQDLTLRQASSTDDLIGAADEGTTQHVVEFEPFRPLNIGDPLVVRPDDRNLLYQVARLRLTSSGWSGSHVVLPRATAHLVGWPDGQVVRSVTHLPSPHEPIYYARDLAGTLTDSFYEIGRIKGTQIPVGLRTDYERRGHIAILGMSGMGKTAVAQRVCATLGADHIVVALDTTGEYETRLGFPSWSTGDFDTPGHFVHQPGGDPPDEAAKFIENCMKAGVKEYRDGQSPTRRVVLLEEAHTFLPEWNVALRAQQERVAYSTRMIMQARKFGVTFIVVSQRTAVVSKSALSQCENYIILKTLDHTGLEYLESLVGPEMRDAIPNLERFEAMCVGPAFNAEEPVIVTLSPP